MQSFTDNTGSSFIGHGFSASTWVHLLIIGFIGTLFACKYLLRIFLPWTPAALVYFVIYGLQIGIISQLVARGAGKKSFKWIALPLVAFWIGALIVVFFKIDASELKVDRWSALDHFWRTLMNGQYPYQAKSHLDHNISGFPGLFLLAAPFYFLGDVGLMQFAGWIGFAVLFQKIFRRTRIFWFLFMLLIGLPAFLYEIECRSDLFTNMVVVAWAIYLCSKPSLTQGGLLFLWAMVWGLLLSTRGVVVIPLVLFSAHFFRVRGLWTMIGFGTLVTSVFLATFAPFYVWDSMLFWEHNPFYVQSGNIPSWLLAMVILVSCYLGWTDKTGNLFFRQTGMVLFATVLICLGLKADEVGIGNAIINNQFDISYFSLSLPFLLISLGKTLEHSLIQSESISR